MKILVLLICIIPALIAVSVKLPPPKETKPKNKPTPIILWHGIGDTCCLPIGAGLIRLFLFGRMRGYIYSVHYGNNSIQELENSYFRDPNVQVDYACKRLKRDVHLKNAKEGFNMIGLGQGSLFLRAVIQRCGHELPPIKNFISFGGPHRGIYGMPRCISVTHQTCDYVRELLQYACYHRSVQHSLVPAAYWHNPHQEDEYKTRSIFLSDINNEVTINETYRSNLKKLEHFVLVKFENDSVVQPRESSWFGFHAPGHDHLQTLQQSAIYLEDRLGLQEMDKAGKLVFLSHPSDHLEFEEPWFINTIMPYLVDGNHKTNVTIN